MNVPGAPLICELRADLSEIARLADAVAAWAERLQIPQAATSAMTLMLEELVTNGISHGYAESGTHGRVEVRLESDGMALVAQVSDAAPAFNPLELLAPDTASALEERALGGLGVHLVRHLAHSVSYRRIDGRNVIRVSRNFVAETSTSANDRTSGDP